MRVVTCVNTVGGQDSITFAFLKKEYCHLDETLQEFIVKQYFNTHLTFERNQTCLNSLFLIFTGVKNIFLIVEQERYITSFYRKELYFDDVLF